jgi:hypothetical protein
MRFDPCNCSLKIWDSIETPIPKVGAHLGVWRFIPSHSPTLQGAWNVMLRLHSWPAPSQALALLVSPRLGLWHILKNCRSIYIFYKFCCWDYFKLFCNKINCGKLILVKRDVCSILRLEIMPMLFDSHMCDISLNFKSYYGEVRTMRQDS